MIVDFRVVNKARQVADNIDTGRGNHKGEGKSGQGWGGAMMGGYKSNEMERGYGDSISSKTSTAGP